MKYDISLTLKKKNASLSAFFHMQNIDTLPLYQTKAFLQRDNFIERLVSCGLINIYEI